MLFRSISEDLIKHVADRLGHDRRYGIDPTKIKNDLGWYPETPLDILRAPDDDLLGREAHLVQKS